MNQFIVFEGIDGAGKTTIAKHLAVSMGAEYLKTPGKGFAPARAYIDNGTPPDTKLLYYLASVHDASATAARTLGDRPVVCDRYLWSSLIPHAAYFNRDLDILEERVQPVIEGLLQPHQTVLITVDEDEQLRRLSEDRDPSTPSASDKFCFDQEKRRAVRTMYEKIATRDGWSIIDTTGREPQEVLSEIQGGLYSDAR